MAHFQNIFLKHILLYYVPHSPLIISLNVFFDGFYGFSSCSTPESVHPKTSKSTLRNLQEGKTTGLKVALSHQTIRHGFLAITQVT